jgi:hypothetical protein
MFTARAQATRLNLVIWSLGYLVIYLVIDLALIWPTANQ